MMSLEYLVKNGVQFGHQSWRICPKMLPFVWGEKNGVHLIDVSKTANRIQQASQFLEEVAARGEPILWVGTKKAAQPVIEEAAKKLEAPYVSNRWIGGTLTNYSEVKKAIAKLKHYESLLEHSEKMYTKKEYGQFRKIVERVEENVGGIRNISWPVGALVVVDAKKEQVAVKEAIKAGIPVVALVDTNTDPTGIDYVIPGNDDISRAIRVVVDPLVEAVQRGVEQAEKAAQQQQKAQQQQEQEKVSQHGEEAAAEEEKQQKQKEDKQEAEEEQPAAEKKTTKKTQQTTTKSTQSQKTGTTQKAATEKSGEKKTATQKSSQQKTSSTTQAQKSTKSDSTTTSKKQSTSSQKSGTKSTSSSSSSAGKTTSKQSTATSTKSSSTKKSSTAEKKQSEATGDDESVASGNEEQSDA